MDDTTSTLTALRAFASAATAAPSERPTACPGWSAHDLLAHVVAGGAEIARLVSERLAGGPASPTTPFAEREPAARALPYDVLLELLSGGGLVDLLMRLDADDRVPFTGWHMDAESLMRHVRSELAIHRWDLVGSDDESCALLSERALTEHAIRALQSFGSISERAASRSRRAGVDRMAVRLRASGEPDVVIECDAGAADLRFERDADGPGFTTDPAARLLMLWGRRPPRRHHVVEADLDEPERRAAERWLYGG